MTAPLPRLLIADDGHLALAVGALPMGVLLQDIELAALIERSAAIRLPVAVDIDSVRGLKADEAAVAFVVRRLGAAVVISRRRPLAQHAAELGAIGLLHANAFDSTGLQRCLPAPGARADGIGTAVSPGLVLPHLDASELAQLPRPILAHGLIVRPADALACLALADAIVLRPDAARYLATTLALAPQLGRTTLTSIAIQE